MPAIRGLDLVSQRIDAICSSRGLTPRPEGPQHASPPSSSPGPHTLEIERSPIRDGVAVISIAGEIDLASADQLGDALRLTVAEQPTAVVLDLGRVPFADTNLVHALKFLHRLAVRIVVMDANPQARRMLAMCGMEQQLCEPVAPGNRE